MLGEGMTEGLFRNHCTHVLHSSRGEKKGYPGGHGLEFFRQTILMIIIDLLQTAKHIWKSNHNTIQSLLEAQSRRIVVVTEIIKIILFFRFLAFCLWDENQMQPMYIDGEKNGSIVIMEFE